MRKSWTAFFRLDDVFFAIKSDPLLLAPLVVALVFGASIAFVGCTMT